MIQECIRNIRTLERIKGDVQIKFNENEQSQLTMNSCTNEGAYAIQNKPSSCPGLCR